MRRLDERFMHTLRPSNVKYTYDVLAILTYERTRNDLVVATGPSPSHDA